MSSLFSQDPEDDLGADLPAFDDLATAGRNPVRALLIGAAGIAVLAGGAAGFLWLGSTPSADASALGATGGATRPSSTSSPTSTPAVLTALSGREVFAGAAGVTAEPTSATTSAAVPSAPSAPPAASPAITPTAIGSIGSIGSTASPVAVTVPRTPTAGGTKAPAPSPAVTPTVATPTPSRSTAPAWDMSVYTFTGIDPDDPDAGNFTMAPSAVDRRYQVQIDEGDVLYPADITFQREVTEGAWITSNRGVPQGWVVPVDAAVPAAAMGRTTGTVRVVSVLNSKQVYVQVNRGPSFLVSKDEKVEGTPFTFVGFQAASLPHGPVYFTDAEGVTSYGAIGSAETDGVTF